MVQDRSHTTLFKSPELFNQSIDKAVHLVFNNKINSKNAFDIDTDFMRSLSNILDENYFSSTD